MAHDYIYPRNDLDNPSKLLGLLGSLWSSTYAGNDLVESIIESRLMIDLETQVLRDLVFDSINRHTAPVWYRPNWWPIRFLKSDINTTDSAIWHFDDDDLPTFDGTPGFQFDTPLSLTDYVLPIDSDIADIEVICNRLTQQSLILLRDIDFKLLSDRNGIVFKENPFDNELIASRPIYQDGQIVDTEILLWLPRPKIDRQLIFREFGYVIKTYLDSSEEYKRVVNHIFDAITGGTAYIDVAGLLSAMLGVDIVQNDTETVEQVYTTEHDAGVITDQSVYLSSPKSTVAVSTGDTVYRGDSLIEDFQIYRLHRGELPSKVKAIVLHQGLLGSGFLGELLFQNTTTTWVLDTDTGRLSFEIEGHPFDVEKFWDDVHQRGIDQGTSLKSLLLAEYGTIPASVNPAEFLVQHVLRNNTLLAYIKSNAFTDSATYFDPAHNLSKIVPPHETLLTILEIEAPADSVTMADIDDTTASTFDGMAPGSDTVSGFDDGSYVVRQVAFDCC